MNQTGFLPAQSKRETNAGAQRRSHVYSAVMWMGQCQDHACGRQHFLGWGRMRRVSFMQAWEAARVGLGISGDGHDS